MSWSSGLQVRIVDGSGEGEVTPLNFDRMTIGRARGEGSYADGWVLVPDKAVSRRHAELTWDDAREQYTLHHLSKTNQTWVEGKPLTGSTVVHLGQKIRVGGSTLLVETATSIPTTPESPARPGKHEMTERLSVEGLKQAISLRKEDTMSLCILSGEEKGQKFQLKGFHITVGRESQQQNDLKGDRTLPDFDNMVELKDPEAVPNHLILKWDELRGGFSAQKSPQAPPVPVLRRSDGFEWTAELGDKPGLVREGDILTVGSTDITIAKPGNEPQVAPSVRQVSLSLES